MNRQKILFLLVLLLFQPAIFAAYPSPTGYVNDFAGVLPQDVKQRLETKLSDYEKQTSIEIAVVTTNTLDGKSVEQWTIELATEWGVGKKNKDNGLVFVVAPKQRKMRIEVGYGLEGDLPDGKCGRIRDRYALPNFRENNYVKGIEETVDAIVKELGVMTLQERAEAKAREAEERKKQQEASERARGHFMLALMFVVVVIALFVLLIVVLRKIKRAFSEMKRKKQLRKHLQKVLAEKNNLRESLSKRIDDAEEKAGTFPDWAKDKAEKEISAAKDFQLNIKQSMIIAQGKLDYDPDESEVQREVMDSYFKNADAHLTEAEKTIPSEIKMYEKEAPKKVEKAGNKLNELTMCMNEASQKGFELELFKGGRDEKEESLSKLEKELEKEKPGFREVFYSAQKVSEGILKIKKHLEDFLGAKKQNDEDLQNLPEKISQLKEEVSGKEKILSQIKQENPEENWKDLAIAFTSLPKIFSQATGLLDSAKDKNSMDKQDFYGALADIDKSKGKLQQAEEIFTNITDKQAEIKEAKQRYPNKLKEAQQEVQKALEKIKNSDVGRKAKEKAKEAESKLKEAKQLAESGSVNWLILIALVLLALSLSKEAIKQAKKDIVSAEEEREEEERRRRQRRSSSYSSSSSYSFGSSSSHSSFGGFGGGSFGGGGCSGSW